MQITIETNKCDGSPFCPVKRVCPKGAVKRLPDGRYEIDQERCAGCGVCVRACPHHAVIVK